MTQDRLPEDIVERAIAQRAEDERLARLQHRSYMEKVRVHLCRLGNCRLHIHQLPNSQEDCLVWTYCQYVDPEPGGTTRWLSEMIQSHPAEPPVGFTRSAPCFRWSGVVPGIEQAVSVLVVGDYYDAHAGGW